jgi:hypothetical protein
VNYGQAALPILRAKLGVRESPADSNDGPIVRVFQAVTGAYKQPWCASFVMWGLLKAGYDIGLFKRSAYCPYILSRARVLHMTTTAPKPGDLVLFDWGHDGVSDHIGMVEKVCGGGVYSTIEGNTSLGNQSNGGQVMRRTRYQRDIAGFVRLPEMPVKKAVVHKIVKAPVYAIKRRIFNNSRIRTEMTYVERKS